MTKNGMDCSGLITVACGMKGERFTTHKPEMLKKYGFVRQNIEAKENIEAK